MKKLLQNKRFILALIVVPNLIIAFLTNGNNALYTLGGGHVLNLPHRTGRSRVFCTVPLIFQMR